jgi:hypothetical protein
MSPGLSLSVRVIAVPVPTCSSASPLFAAAITIYSPETSVTF